MPVKRGVPIAVAALLTIVFAPQASAWPEQHYGSFSEGCGPFGLATSPITSPLATNDCPWAYHGGYAEAGACAGGACAVRIWQTSYGHSYANAALPPPDRHEPSE
ncbi:MAG: hypothetical protein WDA16_03940 [Candidatus Thermoplasmatota archaeon]